MDSAYNHAQHEQDIYSLWEKSGAFAPKGKKPFSIIMPPPNANDPLHVGHALFISLEDTLIRYHRMLGEAALWLPGTDHAGIETQYVFEKKLNKEGKSRFNFDRETLFRNIWDYVQANSDSAIDQMKKLGASADWSRRTFTLDEKVVDFVLGTFEKMYKEGLIYRDYRLVNYCTKCGTGYSELELDHTERQDPLYYLKYGPFTIATVRPETKFRDTALAANPTDPRYAEWMGKTLEIPGLLGPITMTVIADTEVDPEFGTGIMKVTPAHDHHDYDLGKQYNLPITPIIDFEGRMDFSWFLEKKDMPEQYRQRAEKYHHKKVAEARKLMVEDLKKDGLLIKTDEHYTHTVATCYRCGTTIEPLPLSQFYVEVKSLTKAALKALDKKETKVLGAGQDKILRRWLENLKDWNISRQIVWGIRMPVWYRIANSTEPIAHRGIVVGFLSANGEFVKGNIGELLEKYPFEEIEKGLQTLTAPQEAEYVISREKPGEGYLQSTDTLDTWFSSSQWPVVTLSVNQPGDFETYYPTTVMETAYDILMFWVMRMMMMGIYLTGKVPFTSVYLHGLVRDEKGQKMSKSKGNVVNPLDLVAKYGADALRMALMMSTTPGHDSAVGENKVKGMRNFSNKIWNASRFIIMNRENSKSETLNPKQTQNSNDQNSKQNEEFEKYLANVVERTTKLLDKLQIGQAAEVAHNEFWHWFCDQQIESSKQHVVSSKDLEAGLKTFLTLLHPFMPFVTEAIWRELGYDEKGLLISEAWPTPKK